MQLELSERQRTAVATALTIVSAAVIAAAVVLLLWLAAAFLRHFSGVFLPLAVAAVAALVLRPYYAWLRRKLPRPLALAGVYLSILVPLVAFFWFFGALAVGQVADLAGRVPDLWQRLAELVRTRWPQVVEFLDTHPLGKQLKAAVEGQQAAIVQGLQAMGGKALSAGVWLLRAIGAALGWAVLPVYLAFFLMAEPGRLRGFEQQLTFLKEETRRDLVYLAREFVNIVVAFFRGQILIAFLQGLLFALGFSLVGLSYGLVLGLLLGALNVVPYLGSIVGLALALPTAFFQDGGGLGRVGAVLAVFAVVQVIEAYVLTPKIMGDRTGLHPLAIIVSVFFWGTALGGILGMILAIPLTAFLVVFWRLLREKYVAAIV